MLRLIIRKTVQGVMMIVIVSAVTFALLDLAGGDILTSLRENPQVSEQTIEELRRVYGLDRPMPVRYATWLGDALTGDLGRSMYFRVPVSSLIGPRFVKTFLLSCVALAIALVVSVGLALASVRLRNRTLDLVVDGIVFLAASTPRIVLALFALAIVVQLTSANAQAAPAASFLMAAAALATPLISIFLAQFHGALRQTMNEDFIRLARAKGLGEGQLILRHAVRPALDPLLIVLGLSLGGLIGGSVIVESVLGRDGLGTLMVAAVRGRDLPLVMGVVVVTSTAVWIGNTLAEILQAANDKRLTA